jgi:hypothetical protein
LSKRDVGWTERRWKGSVWGTVSTARFAGKRVHVTEKLSETEELFPGTIFG